MGAECVLGSVSEREPNQCVCVFIVAVVWCGVVCESCVSSPSPVCDVSVYVC